LLKTGQFVEVFVDTPIEVCMARDPKGLYKRVAAGQIKNFTGIDSPYEEPEHPELTLKTEFASAEEMAERVLAYLKANGHVP
jgi:adenylylsulfate kinase-like enzyme